MDRKKIAVLLGQADETYQSQFLTGVMKRSFELGYDVYAFSMYIKYQDTKEREIGDSNIYNLINYDMFDAVILLSDTIQTPEVENSIEETIHEKYHGPVICVDCDSKYFVNFWTDGYHAVYKTVSHLIKEHGLTDIAYLTGKANHIHSQKRVEAYRDAMEDYGLTIDQSRIFYGDFWYTSGTACAEILLRDREHLPEAVACANDCMAIGLAEELERNGIIVPDDIVVVGYGTSEEGQDSPKSLTSAYIPAEYYGKYAVDSIIKMMNKEPIGMPEYDSELFIGESCGCRVNRASKKTSKRDTWTTETSEEGFFSIHNVMSEDMMQSRSLKDFLQIVYDNLHHLQGAEAFHLCLNSGWLNPETLTDNIKTEHGYSEQMLHAISYYNDCMYTSSVSITECFNKKNPVPDSVERQMPVGYILTPLFNENRSLGYAVISYGETPRSYDMTYRLWINAVARGLECLRRNYILEGYRTAHNSKLTGEFVNHKAALEAVQTRGMGSLETFSEKERQELEVVAKLLDENLLTYHFQPIVNAVDGEIYSYEALMRSGSEYKISPLQIIKYADEMNRISDIEKATFINVLKIVEERSNLIKDRKIFVNSIPGSNLEQDVNEQIENMLAALEGRIVVEFTEQAELDDDDLEILKEKYRRLGTEIAVDDYGTGYSNVTNLLRYVPDYVKIDRALLSGIQNSVQKQHFVREIIEFCHDNGIQALAEGVETSDELSMVIKLGADLIQGYYVAMPTAEIIDSVDGNVKMEIRRYHRDKSDGSKDQFYIAGKSSRITMSSLTKGHKTNVVIGEKDATYRDITLVGTPGVRSDVHIEIYEDYNGRVTLENVTLSNKKGRPCIRIAENSTLTLKLEGDNYFEGGGIEVPESSKLVIEGSGNLYIKLSGSELYAIGNDMQSRHGALEFYQEGELRIELGGMKCIAIGSGLGGDIKISKGKYMIQIRGDEGVGIGSIDGSDSIVIHDCDMAVTGSLFRGVLIGSVNQNTDIQIRKVLLQCAGTARKMAAIGTVEGSVASVSICDASTVFSIRGDYITAVGSCEGRTSFDFEYASIKYAGYGKNAFVFGGCSDDIDLNFKNIDMTLDLKTEAKMFTNVKDERYRKENVRYRLTLNGVLILEDC